MTSEFGMIAIDIDGTLLTPKSKVSQRTREAIHLALSAGAKVSFATGRNWTESRLPIGDVGHLGPSVFVGGAMVIDTQSGHTLRRTLMEPQLARDVCAAIESMGHAALALQDTEPAGVDYLVSADISLNVATEIWMLATEAGTQRVSDLGTRSHEHTVRVGIVAVADSAKAVHEMLDERFAGRIFCHCIDVPNFNMEVLEVFDPSVNKWDGVSYVADMVGVARTKVIAVGDDINDLHMLRHAGLGVAMGNARDDVKAAAKQVIASNAVDGLAQFIEEMVSEGRLGKVA